MSTTSFKGGPAASQSTQTVSVVDKAPSANSLAVATPTTVGKVSGQVDRSDIILPSLKIVNGNGPLTEHFDKGAIILNNEEMLSDGDTPIKLTVLTLRIYFLEKLNDAQREEGRSPRVFHTADEVRANGGHLEWVDNTPPPFAKCADALVAIESDKEHPLFPFEFNGKHYAVAMWVLSGTAYTRAGKLLITASEWSLRDGLQFGSWNLTTKVEKIGKFPVAAPVLKAGLRNSNEVAEFLTKLVR